MAAALAALALSLVASSSLAEGLEVSPAVSHDGVYKLEWPSGAEGVLEEAESPAFEAPRVVYSGADHATTLSGRPDGTWYYRLRPAGAASGALDFVRVRVEHHSLPRALGFFFVGLIVFLATIALVVRGPGDDDGSTPAGAPRG
jgi:hypothetical protein